MGRSASRSTVGTDVWTCVVPGQWASDVPAFGVLRRPQWLLGLRTGGPINVQQRRAR
jgi:hypothetical protein